MRLRLELSAARAELQAQEGRMVPSSQGGRFRELEQGVAQGSLDVGALQRRNSDLAGQVRLSPAPAQLSVRGGRGRHPRDQRGQL